MSKRSHLLSILRKLSPTSSLEDCLAFEDAREYIESESMRQLHQWDFIGSLDDDGFNLDLDLFAEGERLDTYVAGCDEVGRGCLAGPLVTASVILPRNCFIPGLRDSKQLDHEERSALVPWIKAKALSWAITTIDMDELNSAQANINTLSLEGMYRSVLKLSLVPTLVLVDGKYKLPHWTGPQKALIKGDDRCPAIAAASIIAKEYRDDLLLKADSIWPRYHFASNKGYGTAEHLKAIEEVGICAYHRLNFGPVAMAKDKAKHKIEQNMDGF